MEARLTQIHSRHPSIRKLLSSQTKAKVCLRRTLSKLVRTVVSSKFWLRTVRVVMGWTWMHFLVRFITLSIRPSTNLLLKYRVKRLLLTSPSTRPLSMWAASSPRALQTKSKPLSPGSFRKSAKKMKQVRIVPVCSECRLSLLVTPELKQAFSALATCLATSSQLGTNNSHSNMTARALR